MVAPRSAIALCVASLLVGCVQVERAPASADASDVAEPVGEDGASGTTGDVTERVVPDVPAGPSPLEELLCRPCIADAQCGSLDGEPLRCLGYGPAGSFCGSSCSTDEACPAGYGCKAGGLADAPEATWCVAEAECACSEPAIRAAALTRCTIGQCEGVRLCTLDGLGACDARVPSSEVDDGLDNDCDGQVDEGGCECGDGFCDPTNACGENALTCAEDCGQCGDGGEDACDDGHHCTDDLCTAEGCQNIAKDDFCFIEGKCREEGSGPADAPCLVCDSDAPYAWSGNTGAPCNDGDTCTLDDACDGKTCTGTPDACDDGVLCTLDTCVDGSCFHEEPAEQCVIDGECVGKGVIQPESLGCLVCDPEHSLGSWWPVTGPCDDGDGCTVGDACTDGTCQGEQASCSDGADCTIDTCEDGKCDHELAADHCLIAGKCHAEGANKGENPCLVCKPSADPEKWTETGDDCDDGDPCTEDDSCDGATCVGAWTGDDLGVDDTWFDATDLGTVKDDAKFPHAQIEKPLSPIEDHDWFVLEHEEWNIFANPKPRVEVTWLPGGATIGVCVGYICADGGDPVSLDCSGLDPYEATVDGLLSCCVDPAGPGAWVQIKPVCSHELFQDDDSGFAYTRVRASQGWTCGNYAIDIGDGE